MPLPRPPAGATHPTACCPYCGGALWDNRARKRSPKAPDYRCQRCRAAAWLRDGGPGWRWTPGPDLPDRR